MSFDLRQAIKVQEQQGRVVWFDDAGVAHSFRISENAVAPMMQRGGQAPPIDPAFIGTPEDWLALWHLGASGMRVSLGDRYNTGAPSRGDIITKGDLVQIYFGDPDWFEPLRLRPTRSGAALLPGICDGFYTGTGDKLSFIDAKLGIEIVGGTVLQAPSRQRPPTRAARQSFVHNLPQSIAEDNNGYSTPGSGSSATLSSYTVGTGAQLFGALHWYEFPGPLSVSDLTWNGTSMTDVATAAQAGEQMAVNLRFLASPSEGSFNLVGTLSGTADNIGAGAMSMTGSNGIGTGVTNTGNGTTPSVVVTGVSSGNWAVGAASKYSAIASGDTAQYVSSGGTLSAAGGYISSSGGNETLDWSGAGSYIWGCAGVELNVGTGSPAIIMPGPLMMGMG